jgi:hypothetical protein
LTKRAYGLVVAGRLSRVRRPAFLAALIVSASLYAYSLAGIAGAGGDLPPAASISERAERSAPVAYEACRDEHDDAVRL